MIILLSGTKHMKFNRSQFYDLTDPCSRTGQYEAVINRSHPALLVKLDTRYRTLVTYQTFDCLIKVKTEFLNKSQETYNENEDIAVMMFDVSHGYIRFGSYEEDCSQDYLVIESCVGRKMPLGWN